MQHAARSCLRERAVICAFLLALGLLMCGRVVALPNVDDDDPDGGYCDAYAYVETRLQTSGAYLPGATISIRADPPAIVAQLPRPNNPRLCARSSKLVPTGNWAWQIIERPAASTTQLGGGNTTTVTLSLDRVGVYKVRFSACVTPCQVTISENEVLPVAAASRDVTIRVLERLPPERAPVLPASALQSTSRTTISTHCPWDADFLSAAWRTVEPWSGPADYKLLEGVVHKSKVATTDNNFNHESMDWNSDVEPDPRYRRLLSSQSSLDEVEVEWERDHLPEMFRPTQDDRVSVVGYWIYDCAHSAKTEIHPPALLAVHRPRPIRLPSSAGFGSNVYIPGIVTDIWVNQDAGEVTSNCSSTGLHQQNHSSKPFVDAQGRPILRCLPKSEGFSRNPINRVYEFNIYLPRSPQAVMATLGKNAPEVPLYREVRNPLNSGGPEPEFVRAVEGAVTYLKIRIDLSNYSQLTYSRRIVAGWAFAAPDNWGARRWDVRVTSLNISDDADSALKGDGDWRFWVNTNNGASEWAKLFDCDGCAHGNETFGGRPWETGSNASDRNLGPSVTLFPNDRIWLATSGFEDDAYFEDSIARFELSLAQSAVDDGQQSATDGAGKYTMHFQVLPGTDVGQAQLSPNARALYDAYSLTKNDLHGLSGRILGLLNASFSAELSKARPLRARPGALIATKRQREPLSVEGSSVAQLRAKIQRAMREKPDELRGFFRQLSQKLKVEKATGGAEEAYQFLKAMRPAVPADLWQKYGLQDEFMALQRNR
jgi:hypothetical protein